ncbi:MAG: T9SS type A sorting domain-containing protein [Candidatus Cloacimonetes bacterium]|nr:T9SS type A sorting domain-containing protein [Candidatus Cloacimonadota bacterium]
MKKIVLMIIGVLFITILVAEDYLNEDFSSGVFPPTGWSIDDHSDNWDLNNSNNAGGSSPEARFNWIPQFNDTSRLISNMIDLTGVQNINIDFKHQVDNYSGYYDLEVLTRSNGGEWHSVWMITPLEDIPAETISITVNNEDVNNDNFQICWSFTGNSYNLNNWFIDDIHVYTPDEYDVMVTGISLDTQYEPGETIIPRSNIYNGGLYGVTFDMTCEIYVADEMLYTDTHIPITLAPGQTQLVTFDSFYLENENELYEVVSFTNLENDMNPYNDSFTKWINTYTIEREMVVLELGVGTWNPYSPGAVMGAEDLIENGHDVAAIEYHNGDPYANTSSNTRNTFYEITSFPTAVFDGVDHNSEGDHTQSLFDAYLPFYNNRKEIKTAFDIDIYGNHYYNDYELDVVVYKLAPVANANMILHVVLTESGIEYNWQGMDHLGFVERLMIPDAYGTSLEFDDLDSLNTELSFDLSSEWISDNCELVAFIQDIDTKEILQGSKILLTDLMPVSVNEDLLDETFSSLHGNYPNPFKSSTNISFSLAAKNAENAKIEIYNIKGQKIRSLECNIHDIASSTLMMHSITWDGTDNYRKKVTSGVYLYQIKMGECVSKTRKMILLK